jgi:hypothetical protein
MSSLHSIFIGRYYLSLDRSPNKYIRVHEMLQWSTHFVRGPRHCCTIGKLVASRKSSTSSTDSSSTTLDSGKSRTKRSPAGQDQWDKLAVQLCVRDRELNLGWKLRDGQTCQKLIPKQKQTGATEFPDIVLRQCEFPSGAREGVKFTKKVACAHMVCLYCSL